MSTEISISKKITIKSCITDGIEVGITEDTSISSKPWMFVSTRYDSITIDIEHWNDIKKSIDECINTYTNEKSN